MGFISGLKELFKKPLYAVIVGLFLIVWFLGVLAHTFLPTSINYNWFVFWFIVLLSVFTFVLFLFSFFTSVEKMGKFTIIFAIILLIPAIFFFSIYIIYFFMFCMIANEFITGFFGFKLCMDSATRVDDVLYKGESSRIATRIIEFIIFGLLTWWLLRTTAMFFMAINPILAEIFRIINIVNFILIGFVILRLLFTKKFAAYITLFFLITFFYILYIIIRIAADVIFPDPTIYAWHFFLFDLFLFLYIIGTVFSHVDYLEKKLVIFRADTIALFTIVMKLFVQFLNLDPSVIGVDLSGYQVNEWVLLGIFIGFTLLIGIYSIFAHKEGKTGK